MSNELETRTSEIVVNGSKLGSAQLSANIINLAGLEFKLTQLNANYSKHKHYQDETTKVSFKH